MTSAPMPPDRRSDSRVEGMVQFAGEPSWSPARFVADERESVLYIEVPGDRPTTRIALLEVTAMDELIADRPDHHHIEVAVDRRPVLQAVWPQHFTTQVLAALATTVDAEPPPAPRWADAPAPDAHPEPVVDLTSVQEPTVLPVALPAPPTSMPLGDSAPRRRSTSVLIAALALSGCAAIVAGAIGLSDGDTGVPVSTKVLTQTTLRSPATTVPPAPTTTLVLAAVDPCVATADAVTPTTFADDCEI